MFVDGADEKIPRFLAPARRRPSEGLMRLLDQVVRDTFSIASETPINDHDGPGTLPGWDSLGHMRLLAAVQERFGVRFDLTEIIRIERLSDIRAVLGKKGVLDSAAS